MEVAQNFDLMAPKISRTEYLHCVGFRTPVERKKLPLRIKWFKGNTFIVVFQKNRREVYTYRHLRPSLNRF